jgi:hypothetical protein
MDWIAWFAIMAGLVNAAVCVRNFNLYGWSLKTYAPALGTGAMLIVIGGRLGVW